MQSRLSQAFKRIGRKRSDFVARCHQNLQVPCGELHTTKNSEKTIRFCRGRWEHAGSILSTCQKDRDGRTPPERLHGKKPTQEFGPFGEKVLAKTNLLTDPMNGMNPRYKFGVWLGVRNNSAQCFVATGEGVFRAREVRRIELSKQVGQRSNHQCDRSHVENC